MPSANTPKPGAITGSPTPNSKKQSAADSPVKTPSPHPMGRGTVRGANNQQPTNTNTTTSKHHEKRIQIFTQTIRRGRGQPRRQCRRPPQTSSTDASFGHGPGLPHLRLGANSYGLAGRTWPGL